MQIAWLRQNGGERLHIIVLGWAADPQMVRLDHYDEPDDVVCIFDYRTIERVYFAGYDEVHLTAWSYGIWAAEQIFRGYDTERKTIVITKGGLVAEGAKGHGITQRFAECANASDSAQRFVGSLDPESVQNSVQQFAECADAGDSAQRFAENQDHESAHDSTRRFAECANASDSTQRFAKGAASEHSVAQQFEGFADASDSMQKLTEEQDRINALDSIQQFTDATAINGTPLPMNDQYGISERAFELTVRGLERVGMGKFIDRMCHGMASPINLQRNETECVEELKALAIEFKREYKPQITWNRAIVGMMDLIFPPQSQIAYWQKFGEGTEIEKIEYMPHYPDNYL